MDGKLPTPEQVAAFKDLKQQQEMADKYLSDNFGRVPIGFDALLKEIHDADWPSDVELHPLDFFFLSSRVPKTYTDGTGPYFYVSSSRVRPVAAKPAAVDLSAWTPAVSTIVTVDSLDALFNK